MHKVLNSNISITVILIIYLGWIFGVSAVICVKEIIIQCCTNIIIISLLLDKCVCVNYLTVSIFAFTFLQV